MFRINGGLIVDGSGSKPYENSGILVRGDRMFLHPDFRIRGKVEEIDADGLIIAPGFIDAHSHSDIAIVKNPKAENRILQGITTEVTGNCGFSPFPVTDLNRRVMREEYLRSGVRLRWDSLAEYASVVDGLRPAVNIAPLQGHGNLRSAAMGFSGAPPSRAELGAMKKLLSKSMRDGAFGLSSGLEYTPSSFADWKELAELCTVVSKHNGIYATHMRNEDDRLEDSVSESLRVSRKAGVRLEISHLKSTRRKNWGKVTGVLGDLDRKSARNRGISWDAYPYTACHTDLTITLPKHIMEGGFSSMLHSISDRSVRERVVREMESERDSEDWKAVVVEDISSPAISKYSDSNILDISRDMKCSPAEAVLRLLEANGHDIAIIVHNMSEGDVDAVFSHPKTGIGSDSSVFTGGHPHPRAFGTFPRAFSRYVRELKTNTVESMVRKASALNAERFSIEDRGFVRDGYFADIVVFDINEIRDRSTYGEPTLLPEGIVYLFVNGVLEVSDGRVTGRRGGRVLRHSGR
ncbi:MAG: amidohydrolase family protein [Thermoplasmata archaeon]|uniref:Amidohydrolase family protein n=1 Tax=Candidatus Sysuiplasma superficiale TaxID=2823368 RepID=A0A8J8CGT2_9ARCH|nr:amidohydrolase family protein [Candidatus Sysuiplasma superficiale]MCL4346532.1 amidohydrolase family protein [Candidatus Thermoplasmatota archaeon]